MATTSTCAPSAPTTATAARTASSTRRPTAAATRPSTAARSTCPCEAALRAAGGRSGRLVELADVDPAPVGQPVAERELRVGRPVADVELRLARRARP